MNWCDKCFLQSLRPVTCGLKIAEYFTKRTSYQESNIIMRVCFAALGPGRLAVIDGTLNSAFSRKPLPENPEGDCSAIHWGSSTEWPKYTSKSTFKWLQKTKKKLRFWSDLVKIWTLIRVRHFGVTLKSQLCSKTLQCCWIKTILLRRVGQKLLGRLRLITNTGLEFLLPRVIQAVIRFRGQLLRPGRFEHLFCA